MSRLIAAYPSQLVVRAGERIGLHAHADQPQDCAVDCVRVVQGDPALPLDLPVVTSIEASRMMVRPQTIAVGSWAEVAPERPCALSDWSLGLALLPTRRAAERIGVLALDDDRGEPAAVIGIDAQGCLELGFPSAHGWRRLHLPQPLPLRRWALVSVSLDQEAAMVRLGARIIGEGLADPSWHAEVAEAHTVRPFALKRMVLASEGAGTRFDGKIDAVRLLARAAPRSAIETLVLDPEPQDEMLAGAFDFAIGTGTPAVASSTGPVWSGVTHMLKVKEEFHATIPVLQDRDTRADLIFFETRAGGAVFSTGSIGWAGALATDGFDNDVARITANVLTRFRSAHPFAWPEAAQ